MSFTLAGFDLFLGWKEWLAIALALSIILDVAAMRTSAESRRRT